MSLTRRTSPFGELLSLRQAMDRLFEDSIVRREWTGSTEFALPLDIYTTEDALVVEAGLPGVKPEDVEITITGNTLSISGKSSEERKEEQGGYLYQELRRGSFSRSVTLPNDVASDKANAEFEHGMLRLTIPKAEEAKPRQIKLSAGGSSGASASVGAGGAAQSARNVSPTGEQTTGDGSGSSGSGGSAQTAAVGSGAGSAS